MVMLERKTLEMLGKVTCQLKLFYQRFSIRPFPIRYFTVSMTFTTMHPESLTGVHNTLY